MGCKGDDHQSNCYYYYYEYEDDDGNTVASTTSRTSSSSSSSSSSSTTRPVRFSRDVIEMKYYKDDPPKRISLYKTWGVVDCTTPPRGVQRRGYRRHSSSSSSTVVSL
ncbi:hypothetical protein FOZ63_004014 [Perkinsus olseni]|uniref:Uncharacterized protein n=1 Tax=Perkinsus olseni TaxID=32597 RepID=A0A7J6SNX5_PEROL|nr:hypothetical protein FOZ63_004014 [Perkinsus olseni]